MENICILEKFILKVDRSFTSCDVAGSPYGSPKGVLEFNTTLPEPNKFQYPAVVRGFLVEFPFGVSGRTTVTIDGTCIADYANVGRMFDPRSIPPVKAGSSITIEVTLPTWGKYRFDTATLAVYLLGMEMPIAL